MGAKTDGNVGLLFWGQLRCVLNATSANDVCDHILESFQHPLEVKARLDSDRLLALRVITIVLLQILTSEDGHRICLRNSITLQVKQVDHVVCPTDTVPALNESLLALSKHSVSRIDTIWATRQQAL